MPQESASRKLDQYIVRFPDGMRDRLKEAAAENKRSLNAEIIARLSEFESLDLRGESLPAYVDRLKAELDAALEEKHRMRQLGWDKANAGVSDAEMEARRALQLALDTLEASVTEQRQTVLQGRYMLSQIRLMRGLLDRVAKSDGTIPSDLLGMIRILTHEGQNLDPADEAVANLLQEAVSAIEKLEDDAK